VAAYAATGFAVAGIHALLILRGRRAPFHRYAMTIALLVGAPAAVLQPISGDYAATTLAKHQPAKFAAMEALFETWGARVLAASDLDGALVGGGMAALAESDLVVADLRLAEGASGVDAVHALREMVGRSVPALIVSGDTTDTARAEVAAAGMALLHKPVVAAALHDAAAHALHGMPVALREPGDRGRAAR
jgi:CheY-like chemotaxis protein